MLRLEGTGIKFCYFLSVSPTKKEKEPLTERRQRESKNIRVKWGMDCPTHDTEKWPGHMRGLNNIQGGATALCKLKAIQFFWEQNNGVVYLGPRRITS
jgi:hypothetical protein